MVKVAEAHDQGSVSPVHDKRPGAAIVSKLAPKVLPTAPSLVRVAS